MFKPRWSTFSVLCLVALVVVLSFHAGRMRRGAPVPAKFNGAVEVMASVPATVTRAVPARSLATPAESIADTVRRLLAQSPCPARDEALLAALEKLAMQDPMAAIALARGEANPALSKQMLKAAFTGWGKVDAVRAADWILAQPEGSFDGDDAISAVLTGAVQHDPEAAIALTRHLDEVNPDQARNYGDALIYALGQNGGFQQAADFAAANSGDLRTEWLAAAYGYWANYQPDTAAAYAMNIADPDSRTAAIDAVIPNWAQIDPKNLANFAMNNLPDGDQKTRALSDALVYWAGDDATAAATWLNQAGPGPEFDAGMAAIATQQDVMKQPDVALNWAQDITDVNLRSRTVTAIVQTWALSDRSAALNYIENTQDLQPDDRNSLLANLGASSQ